MDHFFLNEIGRYTYTYMCNVFISTLRIQILSLSIIVLGNWYLLIKKENQTSKSKMKSVLENSPVALLVFFSSVVKKTYLRDNKIHLCMFINSYCTSYSNTCPHPPHLGLEGFLATSMNIGSFLWYWNLDQFHNTVPTHQP